MGEMRDNVDVCTLVKICHTLADAYSYMNIYTNA